jgi:hypothetical protein
MPHRGGIMFAVNDIVKILSKNVEGVIDQRSDVGGKAIYYRVIVGGDMETQALYTEKQLQLISRPAPSVL